MRLSLIRGRLSCLRATKDLCNPDAARAPSASVLAPADHEKVPTTVRADDPSTNLRQTFVTGVYFFLWYVLVLIPIKKEHFVSKGKYLVVSSGVSVGELSAQSL